MFDHLLPISLAGMVFLCELLDFQFRYFLFLRHLIENVKKTLHRLIFPLTEP